MADVHYFDRPCRSLGGSGDLEDTQAEFFPDVRSTAAKPFLKWAGGKQQLLSQLLRRVPHAFNRYFEPFLGSGALFFALGPKVALLSDVNEELVNAYRAVRDDVNGVIASLRKHRNSKAHFLAVRAQAPDSLTRADRAARLIFLNRTCYNGLYRVNRRGQFNTPFAGYRNPTICNPALLKAASATLQGAVIGACEYDAALNDATPGDFVYLDPPYIPVGRYSDFRRYDKTLFGLAQHEELAAMYAALDRRGCYVMLSNSHCDQSLALYKEWRIDVVHARRLINKCSAGRGEIREILVTNY